MRPRTQFPQASLIEIQRAVSSCPGYPRGAAPRCADLRRRYSTIRNGKKKVVLPLLSQAALTTALRRVSDKTVADLFVGINKPKTSVGAFLVRSILAASDFVVVRHPRSFDVCLELGTSAEKLVLAVDTVYMRRATKQVYTADGKQRIGVSLFPYFSGGAGEPAGDEDFLARAIAAIAAQTAQNPGEAGLIFLGAQHRSGLDDIGYGRRVADRITAETGCGSVELLDYDLDTEAMISAPSQLNCLIAMRLHILIAAALARVPKILALPYQAKVVDEAKALGLAIANEGVPTVPSATPTSDLAYIRVLCEWALMRLDSILTGEQAGMVSK